MWFLFLPSQASDLPDLAEQNVGYVAERARNVSAGLQVFPCEKMAEDHGPADLFGRPTDVRCGPPRLCSRGADGVAETADDACTGLEGLKLGAGSPTRDEQWSLRFLEVKADMKPGCASPEAAVAHFYASWLRKDTDWRAVVPPEPTWPDVLRRKLDTYQKGFPFDRVRLEALVCKADDRCSFQVFIAKGESGGRDQGELTLAGACWQVTRPPT